MIHIPTFGKLLLPLHFILMRLPIREHRLLKLTSDWSSGTVDPWIKQEQLFQKHKERKGEDEEEGNKKRLTLFSSIQALNYHPTQHMKSACWKLKADNEENRVRSINRKRQTYPSEPLRPTTTEATPTPDFLVEFQLIF